ncbi:MAG: accessory factor UbiK family protein [Alphaproteobacteria bacterium]|nr:accessory factor UbiK family protein [Alphaproteobacteria bacterium]
MQTRSRIFDDLARVANGALSAAAGVRAEIEQLIRQQLERFLADRDLVTREEFDAVEAMAAKARAQQEALAVRVAALEAQLADTKKASPKAKRASPATAADRRHAGAPRRVTARTRKIDETPPKKE